MARLPEFRALLGLGRPVERTAAIAFRQLLEARGLLRHARFRAVEFQKQHRRLGQAELGVIVERAHGERIDEFDARDRQAGLDRLDDRVAGRLDRRELAGRRRNGFRNSEELQRDLGDDAERALRSHEQTREIVAGGRLLRAPRRLDDAPVRHDDGERQHIVLHRSVAHRVGAGCARRAHAADGGVGAGVDREEQAGVAQIIVQRLAGDARLQHDVEVLGMHFQYLVHLRHVDRHAAIGRVGVPFERGVGAERDNRHAMAGADFHRVRHILGRLREHDRVRRLVRRPG